MTNCASKRLTYGASSFLEEPTTARSAANQYVYQNGNHSKAMDLALDILGG